MIFVRYALFQNLSPGLVESEMSDKILDKFPFIKSADIANGIKYVITQPQGVNVSIDTLIRISF